MRLFLFLLFFSITISFQASAQDSHFVKGQVLDEDTNTALPYANIVVLHKNIGTVSNEKGFFSLDITGLEKNDTLSFQYIGYKTKFFIISELDSSATIYLKEEFINLSEAFVFGNPPNPEFIIKQVLKNKDKNYRKRTAKAQTFIRWRNTSDIEKAHVDLKKNSIEELSEESLKLAASKIPKHNTSYVDFLGDLYFSKNKDDTLKIDPLRVISLKEEDITELEQMAEIFENLFTNTNDNEYWKVKSGILSQKLDIEEETENDSLVEEDNMKTVYYSRNINNRLRYSLMNDKEEWEFLYKTGKYNYTLIGGTRVGGEDVYIIDFTPKESGNYIGRVYISINSYALIRADYTYAEGKVGKDFQLLGVGYTMNKFSGSIFFERKDSSYYLKYFSKKAGANFSVNRSISLLKKRKRFLIDKKLKEIKVKIHFVVSSEESYEVLMLNDQKMSKQEYADFKQKEYMKMIYTDHFDDDLWKGYPIIEPTKRMREYVKPE